jgi:TetR/AcrR family transcriptional regulator, transcriptional repressor for nem operon
MVYFCVVKEDKNISKAERTRQFIIEKTAPIFNKKGYAGTSLSDITAATGLTKGSIYGNFADKDEVALAAFDYNIGKLGALTRTAMAGRQTVREQLMVYVDIYENHSKHPFPEGGCPIMNTTVDADDTHPVLKSKVCQVVLAWKDRLVKLIEKGIATKEFHKEVDAEQTALTLIALIEGAILINRATGQVGHRKSVMKSVEKLIREL